MDLEILKIASDTKNYKEFTGCTHKSKFKNPLCGDRMEVGVKVKNNHILDFSYKCEACIYCQASASLLSKLSINKSVDNIDDLTKFVEIFFENTEKKFPKDWKQMEKLFNRKNLSRKECILLPFKTLSKALKS